MTVFAALLLMADSSGLAGLPLDPIPRQQLPPQGCAAYLWTLAQPRAFVAMAGGTDGRLRLSLDGTPLELARVGGAANDGAGFVGVSTFADAAVQVTLDLTVETRADLSQGAAIPAGTLRLERTGRDGVVVPVVGLIGCAR